MERYYISTNRKARATSTSTGFTLIELMIVVAVLAILVAIAYPSYLEQIQKSRRSDAYNVLLDASSKQVQFFLDNKSYTNDMTDLGFPADPGISTDGYYQVDIAIAGDLTASPPYFKLTATPVAGEPQAADAKCTTLTLDSRNIKGFTGSASIEECWNN